MGLESNLRGEEPSEPENQIESPEIQTFDRNLPLDQQDPDLVEMFQKGPQKNETVYWGCSGAHIQDINETSVFFGKFAAVKELEKKDLIPCIQGDYKYWFLSSQERRTEPEEASEGGFER